jgi:membrane associated rhomboid family serine protease
MPFNLTPAVKNLLIINILFFLATQLLPQLNLEVHLSAFYFNSPLFEFWQPITYMFMHAGFQHILFNMLALVMFGAAIEQTLGTKRFLEYYFITGLGALVLHMTVQALEVYNAVGSITIPYAKELPLNQLPDTYLSPVLGASGAVFGILLAFGFLFPNTEMIMIFFPVPIKAKYMVIGYMVLELYGGVARAPGDSVAHFAHLGGALFGFIMLKIWGYRSMRY